MPDLREHNNASALRETLARRLMRMHDRLDKPFEVTGGIMNRSRNEVWSHVADECIRQMRWTAAEVAHDYRSSEGYDNREDAEEDAAGFVLTAAPEDWKPNA